jgi:hypothetical protein
MRIFLHSIVLTTVLLAGAGATPAGGAEPPDPTPPTNRPNPAELRGRFRNLGSEERLRELRSRLGPGGTNRGDIERRREEWKKLSPAEREARLRDLRERNLARNSPLFNRLTPAEREAKRTEIKNRLQTHITDLQSRQATAPLSPAEQRRLERFKNMARRLEQGTALGQPQRPDPNRPPRRGDGNVAPPPDR